MTAPVRLRRSRVQLENSTQVLLAHPRSRCTGAPCAIHHRTEHSMRSWPQIWRDDRRIFERICKHGCGHPDPDDPKMHGPHGEIERVHGCCGCCHE